MSTARNKYLGSILVLEVTTTRAPFVIIIYLWPHQQRSGAPPRPPLLALRRKSTSRPPQSTKKKGWESKRERKIFPVAALSGRQETRNRKERNKQQVNFLEDGPMYLDYSIRQTCNRTATTNSVFVCTRLVYLLHPLLSFSRFFPLP